MAGPLPSTQAELVKLKEYLIANPLATPKAIGIDFRWTTTKTYRMINWLYSGAKEIAPPSNVPNPVFGRRGRIR